MATTPQENAALVEQFLTDVVAGGDTDALDVFLTDDAADHQPVLENQPGNAPVRPRCWRVLAATDLDIACDAVLATDDRVAVRGTVTGIHRESLIDLAPTGASFEIACAWFFRIDDGQIAAVWSLPDGLGLAAQLRAIPDRPSIDCTPLQRTTDDVTQDTDST